MIDGVFAGDSYQEWGDPIQGLSVDEQTVLIKGERPQVVIGTHANSSLKFSLSKRYHLLTGRAALPDYLRSKEGKPPSVVFEIWLDSVMLWRSRLLTMDDQVQDLSVPVIDGSNLELRTFDGGDGNNNDHATWVDLHLH